MLTSAMVTGDEDPNSILNGAITQSGDYIQIPVSSSAVLTTMNVGLNIEFALPAALVMDGTKGQVLIVEVTWENLPAAQWIAALGLRDPLSTPVGLAAGISRSGANTAPVCVRAVAFAQGTAMTATALQSDGNVTVYGDWNDSDIVDNIACCVVEEAGVVRGTSSGNVGAVALRSRTNLVLFIGHNAGILHTETLGVKARYAIVDAKVP